jgi:hypothetical protein
MVADIEVVEGLAYLANWKSGLRIFDVSNPDTPVELSIFATPVAAWDVEVVDGLAFVAVADTDRGTTDFQSSMRVVDVANPAAPVEIGAIETSGYATHLEVVGDLAYLSSPDLRVIDVSELTAPTELGDVLIGGDVEVIGDRAYAAYAPGVGVADISDPEAPVRLGAHPTEALDVEVSGGLVYAAAGIEGLRIIDLGPEYRPTIQVEIDVKPGSDRNAVNPKSAGLVPVAVLGAEIFDVADIDVTTLAFGPGGAPPARIVGRERVDLNADGRADLLALFDGEEAGIEVGDTEACLHGETLDGVIVSGCDHVLTVLGR